MIDPPQKDTELLGGDMDKNADHGHELLTASVPDMWKFFFNKFKNYKKKYSLRNCLPPMIRQRLFVIPGTS